MWPVFSQIIAESLSLKMEFFFINNSQPNIIRHFLRVKLKIDCHKFYKIGFFSNSTLNLTHVLVEKAFK